MKRFFTGILTAVGLMSLQGMAAQAPLPLTDHEAPSGEPQLLEVESSEGMLTSSRAKAADDDSWNEWEEYTTGSYSDWAFESVKNECINNGGTWPEHKQFKIYRRENALDETCVQFKYSGVFNNVDIIFDYDRTTQRISAPAQTTGILIPEAIRNMVASNPQAVDPYEEYHYMLQPTMFFEASNNFYFTQSYEWVMIASNWGYRDTYSFGFDNYRSTTISLENSSYAYVPSGETSAVVNLKIPEGVVKYRVAKFTEQESYSQNLSSDIAALLSSHPEDASVSYSEQSGASLTVTADGTLSYLYIVSLDASGRVMGRGNFMSVYHNNHPEGEWKPLGTGKLKEHFWTFGADSYKIRTKNYSMFFDENRQYIAPAAEQDVEIEYLVSNPAVYRIKNAFSTSHPYSEYMLDRISTTEDFYMVFDTTDPSAVLIPESLSGMKHLSYWDPQVQIDQFTMSKMENADREGFVYYDGYGKLEDKKITFSSYAIYHSVNIGVMNQNWIELELPGYVEYSMNTRKDGQMAEVAFDGTAATLDVTDITPNVARIEFAMFPVEEYGVELQQFPEKLAAMIASRAEGVKVNSVVPSADHTATLRVPVEDIPFGYSRMVAVLVDADGNYHTSYCINNRSVYNDRVSPLDQWESVGTCYAKELMLPYSMTNAPKYLYQVDIRKCPEMDNVYCVYEPFKTEYEFLNGKVSPDELQYDDSVERYFFIKVMEDNSVIVTDSPAATSGIRNNPMPTGFTLAGDELTLFDLNGCKAFVNVDGFTEIKLVLGLLNTEGTGGYDGDISYVLDYDKSRDMSSVENWDKVADVEIEENIVTIMADESYATDDKEDIPTVTRNSELRKRPNIDGVYVLIDPLAPGEGESYDTLDYDGEPHHLYINVSDPDKVVFCDAAGNTSPTWYSFSGYSHLEFGNLAFMYWVNSIINNVWRDPSSFNIEDYYGKAHFDGEGQLTAIDMDGTFAPSNLNQFIIDPKNRTRFYITLKKSGIEGIEEDTPTSAADEDAAVTYYNLQGVRVADPAPGIYLRRQGNQVTKVVIR